MTPGECITVMMDRIVRDCHPLRVIPLLISCRGEAGPESDVDFLVVLPEVTDERQVAVVQYVVYSQVISVPEDSGVTTPEEIARSGDLVGTGCGPLYARARCSMSEAEHLAEAQH